MAEFGLIKNMIFGKPDFGYIPLITVVMPVRNEERFISSTLKQVLLQDYPASRFEVLVIDGMSVDKTRDIVSRIKETHTQVKLIENPNLTSGAGRNLGFRHGKGDVFVVIDGHCFIPTDQLFKNIVQGFEKSGAHCLGRPQPLDPPGVTKFQRAVALARGSRIGHSSDSLIYSGHEGYVSPRSHGAIYKKEVFDRVGYVDESFDACEDVEFNYRIEKSGLKCYMSPQLAVKYFPRENLRALFVQMTRYGRGRYRLHKKHPETLSPAGIAPLLLTLGAISWLPFVLAYRPLGWVYGILYGLYFGSLVFCSRKSSKKAHVKSPIYLVPIFLAIHFGLGWGLLAEMGSDLFYPLRRLTRHCMRIARISKTKSQTRIIEEKR